MKKYPALVCALAMFALPVFAACSDDPASSVDTILPPEEIVVPDVPEVTPPEEEIVPPTEPAPPAVTPPVTVPPVVAPPEKPAAAEYLKIKTDNLNVRKGAGTNYASLGLVEKNILMKYAGKSGNWYETRYMGQKAFVHSDHATVVSLDKADDKTEKIIEEGLNVLGTPYVYGATRLHDGKGNLLKGFTEKKFDCSSLMQFMFYKGADILLDVTTRTQVLQGSVVQDELKRGDLMFFTNASRKNNIGIERVGHVALYLGDNYILHTASDYAKIEQISSTRLGYYLSAKRMY